MKELFYFVHKDSRGHDDGSGSYVKFNLGSNQIVGKLKRDYNVIGDGILWAMQTAKVIKSHYTRADYIEDQMIRAADVIEDGEIVTVLFVDIANNSSSRNQFKVRILGNYSDCVVFDAI